MRLSLVFTSVLWLVATTTTTIQGRLHGGGTSTNSNNMEQAGATASDQEASLVANTLAEIAVPSKALVLVTETKASREAYHAQVKEVIMESNHNNKSNGLRRLWDKKADVCIMVDGSNGISAQQFQIQKQGIINVITNPTVVPRDGTVAVMIIQYGGVNPKLEVPYTLVNTAADVTAIQVGINAMVQRGGSNNSGDAVLLAANTIEPRFKARQVMVLAAEEPQDVGGFTPIGQALKDAKRSNYKLDSFSVIAFGGRFTDDQFRAFYTPLLIDGQLTFANNEFEFRDWISLSAFGEEFPVTQNTNAQPSITILSPVRSWFYIDEKILFSATATDAEDLQPPTIEWVYQNVIITNTPVFEWDAAWFGTGTKTVLARSIDSQGLSSPTSSIQFEVRLRTANQRPTIAITSPANNQAFFNDQIIPVSALTNDLEDGTIDLVFWAVGPVRQTFYTRTGQINARGLPNGRNTISAFTQDSQGLTSALVTVDVIIGPRPVNTRPVVTIVRPLDNQPFLQSETIFLEAAAFDAEDGALPGNRIVWTIDGVLQPTPGNLVSIVAGSLGLGRHVIAAVATDDNALSSLADQVVIFVNQNPVVNTRPVVQITLPTDGQAFEKQPGTVVPVQATAFDAEDGTLTSVKWYLDGVEQATTDLLASIDVMILSINVHTIAAVATDSKGLQSLVDQVVFQVIPPQPVNQPPTVTMHSPLEGQQFTTAQDIPLLATAIDPEDGLLTGAAVLWSIDGVTQTQPGTNLIIPAGALAEGPHAIRVWATDTEFASSVPVQVTIQVIPQQINQPPSLVFVSPASGSEFRQDVAITIIASVSDPNGDIPAVVWLLDGVTLPTTVSTIVLPANTLTLGIHRIEAYAVDSGNLRSPTRVLTIDVKEPIDTSTNTKPLVEINQPRIGTTFLNRVMANFQASVTDLEDVDASLDVVWSSNRNGVIARGADVDVDTTPLFIGPHDITVTVTDSRGLSDSETIRIHVTQGPKVKITSLRDNQSFRGEIIDLDADVTRFNGRPLPNAEVTWYSAVFDGANLVSSTVIGTGASTRVSSTVIPTGTQEVFAEVISSAGEIGRDSVIIEVIPAANQNTPAVDRSPRLPGDNRDPFLD